MPIQAFLAPMAGVTDIAFRQLCRSHAPSVVTYADMVSARGLCQSGRPPPLLPGEGVQLVGDEPEYLARASERLPHATFLELNAGCPVRKVVSKGQGAALLKDPERLRRCAEALVGSSGRPVAVKVRLGWAADTLEGTAQALRGLGLERVAVHGRTALQGFEARADWGAIRRAVGLFDCPVVGNGDVSSASSAARMVEATGCAGVMVGRAAMHDPLVLRSIERGEDAETGFAERVALFEEYARLAASLGGIRFVEVRAHASWLCRGARGAAAMRRGIMACQSAGEVLAVMRREGPGADVSARDTVPSKP